MKKNTSRVVIVGLSTTMLLLLLLVGCQQPDLPDEKALEDMGIDTRTKYQEIDDQSQQSLHANVEIYGQDGFDVDAIHIKEGGSVTFTNLNTKEKVVTLVFKDGRKLENSGLIEYQQNYERTFENAGTYEFWTVGYVPRGTIIVEADASQG